MIGQLVVQALRVAKCKQIIAVDLDADKLQLARGCGATAVFKADTADLAAQVRTLTNGRGADAAFEVVGLTPSLKTAVDCVRKGGSVTLVGNLKSQVELPLQLAVTRQLTLIGSCASAGEYPKCLDLIAKGEIDVTGFISATPPLTEGAEWFARLYAGEKGLMKVLLKP
jgi:L-iditol 2-dehydrogenase